MKRRTFMQAVIAAIAGLLAPKAKAAPAKKIKTDGQLCLICETSSFANPLKVVLYQGEGICTRGTMVCYTDDTHRAVRRAFPLTKGEYVDGIIKLTPHELRERYIEGPPFRDQKNRWWIGNFICYENQHA